MSDLQTPVEGETGGSKPEKPWYKRWWVWAIAVVVVAAIANPSGNSRDTKTASSGKTTQQSSSAKTDPTSSQADEAQAEPEPEPEPEPAEPTAKELIDGNFGTFATVSKTGKGDGIIKVPSAALGGIVVATHKGSSNFAIEALDDSNQETDLLVNEIGSYRGVTLFTGDEAPVKLKITADGKWTIMIAPVSSAKKATASNSGKGDAVLIYDGEAADWKISHKGSSNFSINFIGTEGSDLLVNEIGNYNGVVPASAGPAVISIGADGAWTMVSE